MSREEWLVAQFEAWEFSCTFGSHNPHLGTTAEHRGRCGASMVFGAGASGASDRFLGAVELALLLEAGLKGWRSLGWKTSLQRRLRAREMTISPRVSGRWNDFCAQQTARTVFSFDRGAISRSRRRGRAAGDR
jgi:hypothetical protein